MKGKIVISVICSVIFFLFANFALAEDWVLYESSKTGNRYYDKSSIKEDAMNKGIFSVWILKVLNKDGKAQDLHMLKSKKKAPSNADTLSYNSIVAQINCEHKKLNVTAWTIYDNKKNNVFTAPKSVTQWKDIDPQSATEKLRKMVCDNVKTSNVKKK